MADDKEDYTTEELINIDQFFQDDDCLFPHNALPPSHTFLHDSEHFLPHNLFESLPGISRYNAPMNSNAFSNLHGGNNYTQDAESSNNTSHHPLTTPRLPYQDYNLQRIRANSAARNPFATDLVKTFLEAYEENINHLIAMVVADELRLEEICLDCQGSRAMQKLIEHVTSSNQRHQLVSALARVAVTLLKSSNGQQVIKQCFACFSGKDVEQILDGLSNHCFEIAIDFRGCSVLQSCIIPASILGSKEHIIGELISNSRFLSENYYGNYVVQFILSLNKPHMTSEILRELSGSYVSLSMNKYGSHVVEKCLVYSSYDQRVGIVNEIITSSMFVEFLRDRYGNFVARKIMFLDKGNICKVFVNQILDNSASLHSNLHGKKVLERAFQLSHTY